MSDFRTQAYLHKCTSYDTREIEFSVSFDTQNKTGIEPRQVNYCPYCGKKLTEDEFVGGKVRIPRN